MDNFISVHGVQAYIDLQCFENIYKCIKKSNIYTLEYSLGNFEWQTTIPIYAIIIYISKEGREIPVEVEIKSTVETKSTLEIKSPVEIKSMVEIKSPVEIKSIVEIKINSLRVLT
ncbi:hypothetical protein C2G38_2176188 [Gigaspora rosea]|uniref:Uncharacterized protein n=1 Tax=Gigaspora rosea TaxID=44941 RepID=A0A397VGJ4_9GLOM|nr:hypothetical protein C2G38_2176188 [Gigaspora rosea]